MFENRFSGKAASLFKRTLVAKGDVMSVPSKAEAIKLANPAQEKSNQQPVTELHTLQGNK